MKIKLVDIDPNPHRNMSRNPVQQVQVDVLLESFRRNKIWPNVVVREHQGRYQLAYGHNRLEALRQFGVTEADFIVRDIDDWGMYTAMVDENESQRELTPTIIYENIESGIEFLEPLVRQCETLEEFRQVVQCRTGSDIKFHDYVAVRNNVLDGQGLGVKFLARELPGDKSTHPANIQAVTDSHYQQTKAKAKQAKAEAKQAEARSQRKQAEAAESEKEAAKHKAEAEKLEKQAAAHEREAEKLKNCGVTQDILLAFPNGYSMTEFAQGVKRNNIPAERHADLANYLIQGKHAARVWAHTIRGWWDVESGAAAERMRNNAEAAKVEKLSRKFGGMDINSTLLKFATNMRADLKDLAQGEDAFSFLEPRTIILIHDRLVEDRDTMSRLIAALEQAAQPTENLVMPAQKLIANN